MLYCCMLYTRLLYAISAKMLYRHNNTRKAFAPFPMLRLSFLLNLWFFLPDWRSWVGQFTFSAWSYRVSSCSQITHKTIKTVTSNHVVFCLFLFGFCSRNACLAPQTFPSPLLGAFCCSPAHFRVLLGGDRGSGSRAGVVVVVDPHCSTISSLQYHKHGLRRRLEIPDLAHQFLCLLLWIPYS